MQNSHAELRRCGVGARRAPDHMIYRGDPLASLRGTSAAQISDDASMMSPSLSWQQFTQNALVGDARLLRFHPLVISVQRSKAKIRERSLKRQEILGSHTSKLLPKKQRTCWIGMRTGAPGTYLGQTHL